MALAQQAQLGRATMLAPGVAGEMRDANVTRLVGTAMCERQDVVKAGLPALHGLSANLADTPVTLPDVSEPNASDERSMLAHPATVIVFPPRLASAQLLRPVPIPLPRPLQIGQSPQSTFPRKLFLPRFPKQFQAGALAFVMLCIPRGRAQSRLLAMPLPVTEIVRSPGLAMFGGICLPAFVMLKVIRTVVTRGTQTLARVSNLRGTTCNADKWGSMRMHGSAPSSCVTQRDVDASPLHFHVHYSRLGAS